MMQRTLLLFLLVFAASSAESQSLSRAGSASDSISLTPLRKPVYGVSIGSEFTMASGYGSALNTFVTPRVRFDLSSKFSIGGGFSLVRTDYFNAVPWYGEGNAQSTSGNFYSATLFVNGTYRFNDRLTVTGSAFKQFDLTPNPLPYNPFNPISRKGVQGVDLNVGYKVGRNMYFQAGFRYIDGASPYGTYPYNNSPFMGSPFGAGQQSFYGSPGW
jgi:hypothetical protein